MTPKEKAEELINKYLRTYPIYDNPTVVISYTYNEAKQCALILVDELIYSHSQDTTDNQYYFWVEVKQEIKKI